MPSSSRGPLLVLLAILIPAAAVAAPAGVDLLATGPSSIRFGVQLAPVTLAPSTNTPGSVTPQLPGWARGGVPGHPALPGRILQVAVPPSGSVTVRGFGSGETTQDGVLLEAEPMARRGASRPGVEPTLDYTRDEAAYRSAAHEAPERARLVGVSWMRNQRVATIALSPADYEPAARRLTVWSRIEVQVDVTPAPPTQAPAEARDPFESVYRATLVNYEQGKTWRRGASSRTGMSSLLGGGGAINATIDSSSVFAGHPWVKIAIAKTGLYRLTFSQIKTLAPFTDSASVAFGNLRLFGWPGLPTLPENRPCDACDYKEIAFGAEDTGGDGRMSVNSDAIYFYAMGPSDWANRYDPTVADTVFAPNQYDLHSFVYLTYGRSGPPFFEPPIPGTPKRITVQSANVVDNGTETHPTTAIERLHLETDIGSEYYPSFSPQGFASADPTIYWDKFYWRTMTRGAIFPISVRTPGIDPTQRAYIRARSWGVPVDNPGNCNNTVFLPQHLLSLAAGDDTTQVSFGNNPVTARITPLLDTLNQVRVSIPLTICNDRVDQSAFSFVEVRYARKLQPDADALTFESPGNGNAIYQVGPFAAATPPRLFDVTDPFAPIELTGFSYTLIPGPTPQYTLSFEVTESGRRRYAMLQTNVFLKPGPVDVGEADATSLRNLRSTSIAADYVLIYYDGFRAAADSLLNWRRYRLPIEGNAGPYDVVGIPISAVYDQFSGGRTDPDAIRNLLRFAFYNWRPGGHAPPAFVTLLGDASFDFNNLLSLAQLGQPGCLLPTFENNWTTGTQFASDDWLMNVDTLGVNVVIPDFFAGRIPANDATSAMDYLQRKLFFYERNAPTGTFRNRVMLIADDDQQGESPDALQWAHLRQTAVLDTVYTPDHLDRDYVYLHTYPDGPGRTKPGAKADIKSGINDEGVAIFNYIGHGSPFKLSDENVLIDTDAGSFTNATRLPLFVAASCDVGKFNDPRVQSLGERLLMATGGGSVGVISATELAYSDFNVDLAYSLYTDLYARDPSTGQFAAGVAPALLTAKLENSGNITQIQNNEKYQLMGDAALRLDLPKLWVEVSLYDAGGVNPITQIHGGDQVVFKGRVVDRPGGAAVGYNGIADLLIEDSQPRPTSPDCVYFPGCTRTQYDFRAGAMFRGSVVVSGGAFQGKFVVPLESLGGPRGKVRAYLQGLPGVTGIPDAVGSIRMQISPGAIPPGDHEGPSISLSFPGGATSVKPDATLNVDLSDPSGILTTGHTVQNGIIVTVDDNTTARTDITSTFHYAAGSYSTGTATFVLPNLASGSHNVKVSAADNLAAGLTAFEHRASASLDFRVASSPPVIIQQAYLFPNPTQSGRSTSGGEFVIVGPGDSVNVMVRVFTVSGRLIRELTAFGGFGQQQIAWDGLDAEGYPLANGTYLFKVYVNGRDERGRSSARQKATAEGRFVILNR